MAKRFLITSAQSCARPHHHFLKGLEKYASINNSEIVILPMIGQDASEDLDGLNKFLEQYSIESGKRKLNNNIQIEQFNVRPYQIDPLTGLSRFAQRETTLVFASPKQRLKPVAHSNFKIPKFLVTTGACTHPNYATGEDVSAERRRLGDISRRDHVYGALIVEVKDDEIYYLRTLRADNNGKFVDLGLKYDGSKTSTSRLEAFVLGDWHTGYTDPIVREATFRMVKDLKPRKIILHDLFDGHSVSPFKSKRFISEQIIEGANKGFLSLEDELYACYKELLEFSRRIGNGTIYVVASNHNEFLDRYLDEGRFCTDALNAKLALKLASEYAKDKLPIEVGIRMTGKLPENVVFLRRDEDLKVQGYQLGSHGDRVRYNGSRSMRSIEDDFGKSIVAHRHSPEIIRDTYVVGTSTPLRLFYTKGSPSNWSNTHSLLWDNGRIQMINLINGKYRI